MKWMNRITRIITGALLSAAMIVTMIPLSGAAPAVSAEDAGGTVSEIAEQFADPENDPFASIEEKDQKLAVQQASELPSSYDLRNVDTDEDGTADTSYVTHVKFQDPFGNCWGFAAISAAETSILGDSEINRGLSADSLDLSEKHLSYFAATPIDDEDDPQNGEGINGGKTVQERLDLGGRALTATSLFSSGVGPVLESVDELLEYKGKEGNVVKEWLNGTDGGTGNYCYSYDDDWSLPESMRFLRSYDLEESYMLPSPAANEDDGYNIVYHYNPEGTAAIKEQLYQNRGVQIGYWDDSFTPAIGQEHGEFISKNWAQYTYDPDYPRGPRHAVCIVGWDDDYPRENFNEDNMPPADLFPDGQKEGRTDGGNGAWLVKNSWGSGEEEFPDKGEGTWGIQVPKLDEEGDPVLDQNNEPVMVGSGYFWLSYYDQSIGTPEALDFGKAESEQLIDQHDLMPVDTLHAANVSEEVKMANVFTADATEKLQQVSCLTSYPDTKVRFEIYLLGDTYDSPTDGLLMDTVESSFERGGFHKVDLNEPFNIMKGQKYAVVVTQTAENGNYAVNVQTCFRGDDEDPHGTAVVNEGESLLFADGEWQDLSDKSLQYSLLEKSETSTEDMAVDNFPVKGFAEEQPNLVMKINGADSLSAPTDEEEAQPIYAMLSLVGDKDIDTSGLRFNWTLEGGDEDNVITLAAGRDPTRKTITVNRCGRTSVKIEATDRSSGEVMGTIYWPIAVYPSLSYIEEMSAGTDSITMRLSRTEAEGLEGYEVDYRIKGEEKWTVKEFDASSATLTLSGLKKGNIYEVQVRSWAAGPDGSTADRLYGEYSFINESERLGGETTEKKKNTITAKGKTVSAGYAALKKSKRVIARKKAITVTKAKGTVTYKKLSGNGKIRINSKTGKITLKKGLKKGKYILKVRVKAAGNSKYKAGSKTVKVKIIVK